MDLRDLLAERSDPPGAVLHHLRMAGVRRKVVRRRRRRLAAGAAGVVLAVVAVAAGSTPLGGSDRAVPPADSTIEGFPEYAEGARVVAAASGPLSERTLRFTVTPGTRDLVGWVRCEASGRGDPEPVVAEMRINGVMVWGVTEQGDAGGTCGGGGRPVEFIDWTRYPPDWPDWDEVGLVPGEPATVTVTVASARGLEDHDTTDGVVVPEHAATLSEGTFAAAIGERVPFEEYVFPPRPEELPELRVPEYGFHRLLLRSDPADPNRAVQGRLERRPTGSYTIQIGAQTPGELTVFADDVEVARIGVWDFRHHCRGGVSLSWSDLVGAGLETTPGEEVTITVQPEHMTGDWYLRLNAAGATHC